MIYVVSKAIDVSKMEGIFPLSLEESKQLIKSWYVIQLDTETNGLDPHINKLTSVQFGYKNYKTGEITAIVVDCNSIQIEEYKEILESSYVIGHNLKFDLQFLYNHNIIPLNVYDTMICEQVLYLGYKSHQISFKLGECLARNVGIEIDKSYQSVIAQRGLTEEGIRYAAEDVMYLQDLRKAQITIAKSRDCMRALQLESEAVPAMAYVEWCGIKLDVKKWSEKMTLDNKNLSESKEALNNYVREHPKLKDKYTCTVIQQDLFNPTIENKPDVTVLWSSSAQAVPVFKDLGFNTTVYDKKTKTEKDSLKESVISVQKGIDDTFLKLYLDYKGMEKIVSSYGQGHLNLINPTTGRLHTKFKQIGTVTGRMSCGDNGKNYDLAWAKGLNPEKVGFVNLQNLPSRGEQGKICRACFIPEKDNSFISCDYSAQESRVQAIIWKEQKLLDAFNNNIDTHNLYAKLCFPNELKDVDVTKVKEVRPDLRNTAKSVEFAVAYGSNGASIAAALGIPVSAAMAMVSTLLKSMPGMDAYKKKTIAFLKKHGYILINKKTGHRVYWPEWSMWKAQEDKFDYAFWQNYKMNHKGTNDHVCKMVHKHMSMSQEWFTKNVLNYPIQGGCATVLKKAIHDLFVWVVKHNYFNKVKFCVFVHDEICIECPKEITDECSAAVVTTMESAAKKFFWALPIPAEASVGDHWIH